MHWQDKYAQFEGGRMRPLKIRLVLANATEPVRAYPRVHGGTDLSIRDLRLSMGLSPLARGNHRRGNGIVDR